MSSTVPFRTMFSKYSEAILFLGSVSLISSITILLPDLFSLFWLTPKCYRTPKGLPNTQQLASERAVDRQNNPGLVSEIAVDTQNIRGLVLESDLPLKSARKKITFAIEGHMQMMAGRHLCCYTYGGLY